MITFTEEERAQILAHMEREAEEWAEREDRRVHERHDAAQQSATTKVPAETTANLNKAFRESTEATARAAGSKSVSKKKRKG